MDGVEQQLEYISDSIGSIDSNIKKLTQAIRVKNS